MFSAVQSSLTKGNIIADIKLADVRGELHVLRVDAQHLQAAVVVRHADVELTVEAPEAAERRVDAVRAVRRSDHHLIANQTTKTRTK